VDFFDPQPLCGLVYHGPPLSWHRTTLIQHSLLALALGLIRQCQSQPVDGVAADADRPFVVRKYFLPTKCWLP
jgi:hypothetical protein